MKKWRKEDIRELRDRLKLTQRAFADLLGVTENYVYLLERGVRTPSKTIELLLDFIEEEKRKGGEKKRGKK